MATAVPQSRVYDAQDAAGIHKALERYAHRRLHAAPEENLEVFKRNLDINESGLGVQTLAALRRFGYRPSSTVAERAERSQSGLGAFFRAFFQPHVSEPAGLAQPQRRSARVTIDPPRSTRVRNDVQPPAAERQLETPAPQRAAPVRTNGMPWNRHGFPVPRGLQVGDPRIGNVAVSDTSESSARRALTESLASSGKQIVPGRRYAVFVDPIQRSPDELNGRGYIFEGTADGGVRRIGQSFTAGTQPTNYDRDLPQVYRDKYYRSWAFGPPTMDAGLYRNVSTELGTSFGGNFSIGTTPATRYGGHEIPGLNRKDGTEILLHTNTVGSLGCIRIEDFQTFSRALRGSGRTPDVASFDVVVARYAR